MRTELEGRTLEFSVAVIRFAARLPKIPAADVVSKQLVRSATSIGANYREANRAESKSDFIHKTALAEKEASETCYWLEICHKSGLVSTLQADPLLREAQELLAIFTTINRKSKLR